MLAEMNAPKEQHTMTTPSKSDDRAGWEHIWRSGDIPPRYQTFAAPNATVVEWADTVPPGGFILDIGCGIGRHLIYLGERGFRMAGMDISPSAIKMAQEACTERHIAFEGQVSDMAQLPWGDQTFDAALSISTINHNRRADLARTLNEVRRVLKPGGLFIADFLCTDTLDYQLLRDQVAAGEINEVEPNTFVDDRPDSEDPDGFLPHHYSDEADLRDLLSPFEVIKLWADLKQAETPRGTGLKGKWVAWMRKP
jgi:SAM-dependent methyltransferase